MRPDWSPPLPHCSRSAAASRPFAPPTAWFVPLQLSRRCRSTHVLLHLMRLQDGDIDSAKQQVQGQLAAQYIQDVMQKITDKCFTRCVLKPGARLDDSEKLCTAKCMDRYLDAMALVSQAWAARAKQQAQMQGGGGMGGFQ